MPCILIFTLSCQVAKFFERPSYLHISAVNYPILIKLGTQVQVPIPSMEIWQKIEIFQIQHGGRTPYWILFLAISRRLVGRSTRNSVRRWKITCQYRSRDQNCNFRKFKMADGRHFENSFISISQPWIIRFWSNLVYGCKFPFRAWNLTKNRNFANSRWRTDAILKWLYLGAILAD